MNIHFTYKSNKSPDLEKSIDQQIQKLGKRLQVFRPDLVSLYGTVDNGAKMGVAVSLNLRLPTGQLAATETADRPQAAVKAAFEGLLEQLSKHKDHLRSAHKWPRERRVERSRGVSQVPFEETLAAVKPEQVDGNDIAGFVNMNLPALQRTIERELRYRELNGSLRSGQISPEEVVDEAISHALDDREQKPERIRLEAWLHRLALRSIDRLMNQTRTETGSISLDSQVRHGQRYVGTGSDEPWMQYHQPDEMFTNENLIPDSRIISPEDIAATDEIVTMVEVALQHAKAEDREAFILFTMEGFTTHEISVITGRKPEEVRASVSAARDLLRKSFPTDSTLKNGLGERSRSA
jgi:DNA-directed RNA polymerase specialized sigma24 family protein/ribosome-associated translation inhibitor RaiA